MGGCAAGGKLVTPHLLTIEQAAEFVGKSPRTINRYIKNGKLGCIEQRQGTGRPTRLVTQRALIQAGLAQDAKQTQLERQLKLVVTFLRGHPDQWYTTNELQWQGRLLLPAGAAEDAAAIADELRGGGMRISRPTNEDEIRRQPLEAGLTALRVAGLVEKVAAPLNRPSPGKPKGGYETKWRWKSALPAKRARYYVA